MEVESSIPKSWKNFVLQKELNMKLQLLTLHNIMELQREEIELCLIWQGECSKARGCLIAFGERLSPLQPIFSICVLQKNWRQLYHKQFGLDINQLLVI